MELAIFSPSATYRGRVGYTRGFPATAQGASHYAPQMHLSSPGPEAMYIPLVDEGTEKPSVSPPTSEMTRGENKGDTISINVCGTIRRRRGYGDAAHLYGLLFWPWCGCANCTPGPCHPQGCYPSCAQISFDRPAETMIVRRCRCCCPFSWCCCTMTIPFDDAAKFAVAPNCKHGASSSYEGADLTQGPYNNPAFAPRAVRVTRNTLSVPVLLLKNRKVVTLGFPAEDWTQEVRLMQRSLRPDEGRVPVTILSKDQYLELDNEEPCPCCLQDLPAWSAAAAAAAAAKEEGRGDHDAGGGFGRHARHRRGCCERFFDSLTDAL